MNDVHSSGAMTVSQLSVWVPGRPAPKGSHKLGQHGQLRNASAYLAAWSGAWTGRGKSRRRVAGAVERAVYEQYAKLGVTPDQLPLFTGPIGISIVFMLDPDRAADGPPDGDKLDRATWDALTIARVWADDARVVAWGGCKTRAGDQGTGALITVWPEVLI